MVLFEGRTIVIDNARDAEKATSYLSRERMVGFDTETRPSFKKGNVNKVALMQVSTLDTCFLFRLNRIDLPDCLVAWLQDSRLLKVGLSLSNDYLALHRRRDFKPAGFIDLQDYAHEFGIEDMSLQKIYAILFGEKISKGQRLTNWEGDVLDDKQKSYAATDAWACLKIYNYLNERKRAADYQLLEENHEHEQQESNTQKR